MSALELSLPVHDARLLVRLLLALDIEAVRRCVPATEDAYELFAAAVTVREQLRAQLP